MSTTITGLTLAPVLVIVGCAQAIARHDLFERRDSRIGRIGDRARQDSFPFPTSQRRVGT